MWMTLFSLMAGATLPLAFAPFNLYSLGFISPAILLWIWLRSTPGEAAYRGYLFGLGFFGVGTSWIYISIHNFGNASIPLALFITAIFVLFLALYFALQGYLSRRFFQYKSITIQSLCIFPAMWLILEGLRAYLLTGFPWLSLGYSQFSTPLQALAPLFSVYGISLATCLISGALVVIATYKNTTSNKVIAIIIIVVLMTASWSLKGREWTKPVGKTITVSLVQGNIAQHMKWQPGELLTILEIYKTLTSNVWRSTLIIWPEAAVPTYPQDVAPFYTLLNQRAKQHSGYLIIGSPLYNPNTKQFYNGLRMIGTNHGIYYKRHLVPFGEYILLPSVFNPLMKRLNIPMSNFAVGPKEQAPLQLGNINIASFICYEIAFSRDVLRYSHGTQLLINISDDSWFGRSIARDQQTQMAQFRALETGRPVLSSTNTGITVIIDPLGNITMSLPTDQRKVLSGSVMPMMGETPLMRWHYYPLIILIIVLLIIGSIAPRDTSE